MKNCRHCGRSLPKFTLFCGCDGERAALERLKDRWFRRTLPIHTTTTPQRPVFFTCIEGSDGSAEYVVADYITPIATRTEQPTETAASS